MNPLAWIAALLNRNKKPGDTPVEGATPDLILPRTHFTPGIDKFQTDEERRKHDEDSKFGDGLSYTDSELIGIPKEKAKYQGILDNALATLNTPPPKPEDPSSGDVLGSVLAMLGNGNEFARERAAGAPFALADQRNALALKGYEGLTKNAGAVVDASRAVIGDINDRQTAILRVRTMIEQKSLDRDAKVEAASLKQNGQFWMKAAELIGKGQATGDSLAGAYQMLNPGADPQKVQAIVQQMAQDPSTWSLIQQGNLSLKQQHVENETAKGHEKEVDDTWKRLQDPNASVGERAQLITKLKKWGEIDAATDPFTAAQSLGSVAEKNVAGTADLKSKTHERDTMLPHKVEEAISKAGLNKERTALLRKQVTNFDADLQSKIALRMAEVSALQDKSIAPSPQRLAALNSLKTLYRAQIDRLLKKKAHILGGFDENDAARLKELEEAENRIRDQIENVAAEPTPVNPMAGGEIAPMKGGFGKGLGTPGKSKRSRRKLSPGDFAGSAAAGALQPNQKVNLPSGNSVGFGG